MSCLAFSLRKTFMFELTTLNVRAYELDYTHNQNRENCYRNKHIFQSHFRVCDFYQDYMHSLTRMKNYHNKHKYFRLSPNERVSYSVHMHNLNRKKNFRKIYIYSYCIKFLITKTTIYTIEIEKRVGVFENFFSQSDIFDFTPLFWHEAIFHERSE